MVAPRCVLTPWRGARFSGLGRSKSIRALFQQLSGVPVTPDVVKAPRAAASATASAPDDVDAPPPPPVVTFEMLLTQLEENAVTNPAACVASVAQVFPSALPKLARAPPALVERLWAVAVEYVGRKHAQLGGHAWVVSR